MDVTKALVLEADEPLSKALSEIMQTGTAVIIVKNGVYNGIIDDRHIRQNIADPSKIKCSHVAVIAPALTQNSNILEKLNNFLSGHFKALPVVDERKKPVGILTRADFLSELVEAKLIPKMNAESIMSSPVISLNVDETVGAAKTLMKEHDINRLVVLNNGYPYALLSKFDLVGFSMPPKKRKVRSAIQEVVGFDSRRLADLALREIVATVGKNESLNNVARKMAEKKVSALIVLSNKKPVGVLTAADIFKNIMSLFDEKNEINISGLAEENSRYSPLAREKINSIVKKFSKTFNICNLSIHFKKRKTLYIVKVFAEVDHFHVAVSYEGYDAKTAINGVAREFLTILERKKERLKEKKGRPRRAVLKGDAL